MTRWTVVPGSSQHAGIMHILVENYQYHRSQGPEGQNQGADTRLHRTVLPRSVTRGRPRRTHAPHAADGFAWMPSAL